MKNEGISAAASSRPPRRWYRLKRFWSLVLVVLFAVWLIVPSTYSKGKVRFSIHYAGTPGTITFVIRDPHGVPLPGIDVVSESFSGTTDPIVTDASGVAVIRPGESEVLAVYIADAEFRFRPRYSFLEHFAPDCSYRGLTLPVTFRD